ncbi:hypothetical protein B0O80DRAFT_471414 [Mortierella sp. GBAus27b]|nr:hypothetical protein B0O80DRAFT_471414 [Mortierella sp. GBAus27b]
MRGFAGQHACFVTGPRLARSTWTHTNPLDATHGNPNCTGALQKASPRAREESEDTLRGAAHPGRHHPMVPLHVPPGFGSPRVAAQATSGSGRPWSNTGFRAQSQDGISTRVLH